MGIPTLRTFWIVLKRLFQYSLKFINQFLDRCSVVRSLILRLFGLSVNFIAHFLRVMRILLPLQGDRVHETRGIICGKFGSTFANPAHHVVDPVLIRFGEIPQHVLGHAVFVALDGQCPI